MKVTASDFSHGKVKPLLLDLTVGQADLPKPFGSSFFEPAQIVGVVDDAHLIGVAVDDAVGSDVFEARGRCFHEVLLVSFFLDLLNAYSIAPAALTKRTDLWFKVFLYAWRILSGNRPTLAFSRSSRRKEDEGNSQLYDGVHQRV